MIKHGDNFADGEDADDVGDLKATMIFCSREKLHCFVWLAPLTAGSAALGEISSDLYCFVQCDIKKCAFDFLKLEQNPWNCD